MLAKRDLGLAKLITFDVTGTLVKFRKPPHQIYLDKGLAKGLTIAEPDLKSAFKNHWIEQNKKYPHFGEDSNVWWSRFVKNTFKDAIQDIKYPGHILDEISEELIKDFSTIELYERAVGSIEFLEHLKKSHKSCQLGIITNFDSRIRRILDELGYTKYFDDNLILISHEVQKSKPNKDIFIEAMHRAGLNENDDLERVALHIGDTYDLDFIGSKMAGWNSIMLADKVNKIEYVSNSAIILKDLDHVHKYFTEPEEKENLKSAKA